MHRRLLLQLLLAFPPVALSLIACAPQEPPVRNGLLDLRTDTAALDRPLRLDGEWEFYWRNFLYSDAGAATAAPKPAPAALVAVPNNWSSYRENGERLPAFGYASYRLRLLLPEARDGMALRILDAGTAYRLYVNGELILERGRVAAGPVGYRPILTRSLTPPFRLERESEIVFEIANFAHYAGGMRSSVELGRHKELYEERRGQVWLVILIIGAMVFMALYHVLLFSLDWRELPALFFAGMCICICLRLALFSTEIGLILLPELSYEFILRAILTATYLVLPLCVGFVVYLFPGLFDPRVTRFAAGGGIAVTLFSTFTPLHIGFGNTVPIFGVLFLSMSVYGLYRLVQGFRQDTPDTGLFLFAFLWFIVFATNDWLYSMRIINTGFLTEYGFTVFVFSQAIAVSRRILKSRRLSETLAADLQKSNTRLLSLDRLKDEFLAVTSHELRTPLQGIIGIAGSMRGREAQTSQDELDRRLDLIVSSGRRLADLVGEILDFSSLRYGELRLNLAPVDLHAFTRRQLTLIEYNLEPGQTLELRNEVAADLPPVLADEARLTQIFQNLLGNAIKHTHAGTVAITATMPNEDTIEIRISDTGTGIPPEQLERIFLPFEQGQGSAARRGGIGLGLSIARALTELHEGSLRAESRPGAGTSFILTLPRSRATRVLEVESNAGTRTTGEEALSVALPRIEANHTASFADSPTIATDADLPFVLLVDDEAINLEVMQAYLEDTARVAATDRIEEIRELLRSGPAPDCLVLDLMMPVSGLEIMRELRETHSQTELPILIVTAMTRTTDLLRALEIGANDYLTKPFEKEEFLLRVSNLTTLAREHRGRQTAVREAARNERERINADLHDHLGAALTDLKIMSDRATRDPELDPGFTNRLRDKVGNAIRILREDMLDIEDHELLDENFLEGLQLMLLRRYVDAGRRFIMHVADDASVAPEIAPVLLTVLKEMVTNDLKYGAGPATLRFIPGSTLQVEFESLSRYRLESHGTGRGTGGMIRRLHAVGGTLRIHMDEDSTAGARPIRVELHIPAGSANEK